MQRSGRALFTIYASPEEEDHYCVHAGAQWRELTTLGESRDAAPPRILGAPSRSGAARRDGLC